MEVCGGWGKISDGHLGDGTYKRIEPSEANCGGSARYNIVTGQLQPEGTITLSFLGIAGISYVLESSIGLLSMRAQLRFAGLALLLAGCATPPPEAYVEPQRRPGQRASASAAMPSNEACVAAGARRVRHASTCSAAPGSSRAPPSPASARAGRTRWPRLATTGPGGPGSTPASSAPRRSPPRCSTARRWCCPAPARSAAGRKWRWSPRSAARSMSPTASSRRCRSSRARSASCPAASRAERRRRAARAPAPRRCWPAASPRRAFSAGDVGQYRAADARRHPRQPGRKLRRRRGRLPRRARPPAEGARQGQRRTRPTRWR